VTRRPYLSVCSGIEAATVAWEPYRVLASLPTVGLRIGEAG
jgi:hypothetical protein